MHVLNGAIYSPTFLQSSLVCDRVLSMSPVLFAIYIDDVSKCSKFYRYSYVILYADDILLLAPTVTLLDRLFTTCEVELNYLDIAINLKEILLLTCRIAL